MKYVLLILAIAILLFVPTRMFGKKEDTIQRWDENIQYSEISTRVEYEGNTYENIRPIEKGVKPIREEKSGGTTGWKMVDGVDIYSIPDYNEKYIYNVGDKCKYNGVTYKATQITKGAIPGVDDEWEEVLVPEKSTIGNNIEPDIEKIRSILD